MKSTFVLQITYSDVMRPFETKSGGGARFLMTFIDEFSRFVVIYVITHKPEIVDEFKKYKAMMENQKNEKNVMNPWRRVYQSPL